MNKQLYRICIFLMILTLLSTLLAGCSGSEIYVNTEQNAVSYVENEDYQGFLDQNSMSAFAKAENGYYFFNNMHLYFFDTEKKEAYLVCSKANCEHDTDSCTALFSIFNFYPFQLEYYGNSLYVLGWEEEGNNLRHNYIYEISLDNYKRKKAAYLFDSAGLDLFSFMIHRGYVYYLKGGAGDLKETTSYLYRVKLGNTNEKEKSEVIYEFSGIGASISNFSASGNNIIVLKAVYGDTEGNNYETSYDLIDIHSLESRNIVGNEAYSLFAEGEYAFYEKGENTVNRINLNTKEEAFFCNIDGPAYISADSNYIYFDNRQKMYIDESFDDRKIFVFDKSGNYVTEITPRNPKDDCYFGGDDVMIFKEVTSGETVTDGSTKTGAKGYYVLDKSQITSPDKQFVDME